MADFILELFAHNTMWFFDIACSTITPFLLVILTVFGRIYLKRKERQMLLSEEKHELQAKELLTRIYKVEKICNKTADKLYINETKTESISRLMKSKTYYLSKIEDNHAWLVSSEVVDKFMSCYKNIVKTFKIGIDSLEGVQNCLYNFMYKAKQIEGIKVPTAQNEFIRQKLDVHFGILISVIEEVLTSPENTYEKKFEIACFNFVRGFILDVESGDEDMKVSSG